MLRFTNKENNYFTPVIKHFVGSEKWEEEGCEKIKWRSLKGLLLMDVLRPCVVVCEEVLRMSLWKSPLNLRGV